MNRLSARNKLLLALASILFFSFLGVSYLNYKFTRRDVHAEILRSDLPLTMDNIYSELTSELTRPLVVSSSMATDTFLKAWAKEGELDSHKIVNYLRQIKDTYGFFTTFFVSVKSDVYYRYNGVHKTVSEGDAHDVWLFDFLSSDKNYDFDVDNDEAAANILTIFINYKVFDLEGELIGVTGVGLKVESVARLITEYQEKYGRAVYLTDAHGVLMVHPDTSLIEKKKISEMEEMAPIAREILHKGNDSRNFEFDRNGSRILLTVRYIDSLDWFLYVEQNETKSLVIARNNFIRTVIIGLIVSVIIVSLTLITINRYQEKLELLAISDELTGASNRRALEAVFDKTLYDYSRSGRTFSLILLDLDGFKKVNDTMGHIVGDRLLIDIVKLITKSVRPTDTFARWGGDEFVILSGSSGEDAAIVAARILQEVEKAQLGGPGTRPDDPRNRVTVSGGISVYSEGDNLDAMISRADQAMYKCKARGGNCVELGA